MGFAQRAAAAFCAISRRRSGKIFSGLAFALAKPPKRPKATAAAFFFGAGFRAGVGAGASWAGSGTRSAVASATSKAAS